MFHINEIEAGVGKSRREVFMIFNIGFILVSCFFIKSSMRQFGWGCTLVGQSLLWIRELPEPL